MGNNEEQRLLDNEEERLSGNEEQGLLEDEEHPLENLDMDLLLENRLGEFGRYSRVFVFLLRSLYANYQL